MAAASALSSSCSSIALLGRQALRQSPQYALRLRVQAPLSAYILQKGISFKGRLSAKMGSQMPAVRSAPLVSCALLVHLSKEELFISERNSISQSTCGDIFVIATHCSLLRTTYTRA